MKFISVDSICLSYRYKENLTRNLASSFVLDSYIDESTRKFYILKKHENSESRYIQTMVNYLLHDQDNRLKLSYHIQNLLKIYQDDGLDGLNKKRENLPEQQLPKWVIPRVIKKELIVSSLDEDQDEVCNEPVSIPKELLEEMLNEPDWRLLKQNINRPVDPNQPKVLTCFPTKSGSGISTESSPISTHKDINSVVPTEHRTVDANNQTNEKKIIQQVKSNDDKKSSNGEI